MITFLTSSFVTYQKWEDYHVSPLIDENGFVDKLKGCWREKVHFLLFVSDPDDASMNDHVAGEMLDSFSLSGLDIEEMRIYDHRCDTSLEELLRWADVLYLAGGHAPTQNAFMGECGLRERISDFDGIVLGLSAGTANAATEVYLMPEEEGEAADPDFVRFTEGLGLTDLKIVPHRDYFEHKVLDGKRVVEDILLPDSMGKRFYFISDGSYFLIRDGVTEFFGQGEVMEDGKITSLQEGRISDDICGIDRQVWETLVQTGYDCIFELEAGGETVHFLHVGAWMRGILNRPVMVDHYIDFCRLLSEKAIVEEEKEPFLVQAAFSVIEEELRSRGNYVRTVHMDSEDGRKAKSFRVYRIGGCVEKLLCTIYDISAALDHDWMTDEYARSGFLENAQKMIRDFPAGEGYSLVYTNVRGFKAVNDLFGTQSGDMLLFQVRDELRRILEPVILGRFENDHYVLITKDSFLTDENLQELCHQTYTEGYKQYEFYIRCGIYHITKRDVSINHIVDRAKLAERSIRDDYGVPYAYYDDTVRVNYVKQRVLMSDMKGALHDNEFKVFFQPLVNAKTGGICSAEALVRWQHHDLGMVSPGEFVPVFEKEGMISALDRFIVNRVMDFTLERVQANQRTVPCAVNLSRIDFFDPDLMNLILERVTHSEFSPNHIRIEVTESAYVVLEKNAMDFLSELKRNGVQILLDDYGSGMSSLSTLESFEFDIVKLDMGFIRKIGISRKAEAIIRSTIDLAHAMGARVTAEGVETEEQSSFLVGHGCDMIQGYYYYRPVPEEQFSKLLDDRA